MRRIHVFLILIQCVAGCASDKPVTIQSATYKPDYFFTADGDSVYFQRPSQLIAFGSHHLIVLGQYGLGEVWLLDLTDNIGRMVGRMGQGPGEYTRASSIAISNDTLLVYNSVPFRLVKYLMPEGRHLETISINTRLTGPTLASASDGGFYATTNSSADIEWIIAKFGRSGEIVDTIGEREIIEEKYGRWQRGVQQGMTRGYMLRTNSGDIAFVYSGQPRMLIFSESGELIRDLILDMPWYDEDHRPDSNPIWIDDGEMELWFVRTLVRRVGLCKEGIIIASNTNEFGGQGEGTDIIAVYSEKGVLKRVLQLPRTSDEVFLTAVAEQNGRFSALLTDFPFIREVVPE
ncbi:hypothetical protein ACFL39_01725 [Gemmatimonadota bacterium]